MITSFKLMIKPALGLCPQPFLLQIIGCLRSLAPSKQAREMQPNYVSAP